MAKAKANVGEVVAEVATAAYLVVQKLRHNGKDYKPKSTVQLDAASAKRLVALGAVKPVATPAAPVEAAN